MADSPTLIVTGKFLPPKRLSNPFVGRDSVKICEARIANRHNGVPGEVDEALVRCRIKSLVVSRNQTVGDLHHIAGSNQR
jgi:hypothetical protein